jgi:hypothetical protein
LFKISFTSLLFKSFIVMLLDFKTDVFLIFLSYYLCCYIEIFASEVSFGWRFPCPLAFQLVSSQCLDKTGQWLSCGVFSHV